MIESIPIKSEEQARAFEAFRTGATAEHVAPVVSYLCSDTASGINGQVFGVRGNEIYLFNQPRPVKTIHNGGVGPMKLWRRPSSLRSGMN